MIYGVLETLVLMIVLLLCLWHVTGRLMPQGRAALQLRLAERLLACRGWPRVQRIGLRLIPKIEDQSCGSACSRCGACGVTSQAGS